MTVSDALEAARAPTSATLIRYRFEGTFEDITRSGTKLRSHLGTGGDIVEIINQEFDGVRRKNCHVHTEIQLVDDFENRRRATEGKQRVHPYIRGSKLYCYHCDSSLRHHGFFQYQASHCKVKPQWTVPTNFKAEKISSVFGRTLRLAYQEVSGNVSLMKGDERLSDEPLRADSTVGLSTAATVSSQESSEMTLKLPLSRWMGKEYVRILC